MSFTSTMCRTLLVAGALALEAAACSSAPAPTDGGSDDDSSMTLDSGDGGEGNVSDCIAANDCVDACFNSGTVDANDVQSCINDCCTTYACPSAPDCFSDF